MELAERIRDGVEALRKGRPVDAVELLGPAANDPDLATAEDLVDVRARVCSLLAQALIDAGRGGEAARWVREARACLARAPDEAGERELRELERRAFAGAVQAKAAEKEAQRVAATPIEELLRGVVEAAERAQILLEKAAVELDAGRAAAGAELAHRALGLAREAGGAREEVIALLSIARASPGEAEGAVRAATERADRSKDFNLVTTVARAALALGLEVPTQVGPALRGRGSA